MKIILAITEDKYGCNAIAELIRKLEENKKIENEIKLDCHSMGRAIQDSIAISICFYRMKVT